MTTSGMRSGAPPSVLGTCAAERGRFIATDTRRDPHPAAAIHHRVVDVRLAVPDRLRPPVRRRFEAAGRRRDVRLRIARRNRNPAGRMRHRVEHRQVVVALLERPVERPVGVDGRVALVGGDLIVRNQKFRSDQLVVQTGFQEGVIMVAVGKIDLPKQPAITMVHEAVRVPEGARKPVHESLFTNRDSVRDTMPDPAAHICYAVPESS